MTDFGPDESIQELFKSLLQRYQMRLEQLMNGSNFVLDGVEDLHYKCHKISLNLVNLTWITLNG